MRQGFATTALVIMFSLFPGKGRRMLPPHAAGASTPDYIPIPRTHIPLYLGQLDQAVNDDGRLALFFPDCAALAAPFLLFRLKRNGYSDCSVTSTGTGLLVDAKR